MSRAPATTCLGRGLRRRCPHCGRAPLFTAWLKLRDRCSACGLITLRNQGDHWGFLLVLDRAPLLAVIAILYFQLYSRSALLTVLVMASVVAAYVATIPQRVGLAVALDYLTRRRWPDPEDELPEPGES